MGLPAAKFEMESIMEQRVTTLEANVGHIQSDIAEMKVDIRRLNDKVDHVHAKLDAKIDGVRDTLTAKIDNRTDSLQSAITALAVSTEKSFAAMSDRSSKQTFWIVGLLTTVAVALIGLMTGGFLWLADKIGR